MNEVRILRWETMEVSNLQKYQTPELRCGHGTGGNDQRPFDVVTHWMWG